MAAAAIFVTLCGTNCKSTRPRVYRNTVSFKTARGCQECVVLPCDDVIVYLTLGVWLGGGGVSPAVKMVGVH